MVNHRFGGDRTEWLRGFPRQPMICFSVRMTRSDGNKKSTSMPGASRLKSSITLNTRMLRPSASWSCMKSIDHAWFPLAGTVSGSGVCRISRSLSLNRRFSSSSQLSCAAGLSRPPAPSCAPSAIRLCRRAWNATCVGRSRADTQLPAPFRTGKTNLHAPDDVNDLAVPKSRLLHSVEPLNEKILLMTTSLVWGITGTLPTPGPAHPGFPNLRPRRSPRPEARPETGCRLAALPFPRHSPKSPCPAQPATTASLG